MWHILIWHWSETVFGAGIIGLRNAGFFVFGIFDESKENVYAENPAYFNWGLSGWGINWILLTNKDGGKNHDTDYVFFSFRIAKSGT